MYIGTTTAYGKLEFVQMKVKVISNNSMFRTAALL